MSLRMSPTRRNWTHFTAPCRTHRGDGIGIEVPENACVAGNRSANF